MALKPAKFDCTTDAGNSDRGKAVALIKSSADRLLGGHLAFSAERTVEEDGSFEIVIKSSGKPVESAETPEEKSAREKEAADKKAAADKEAKEEKAAAEAAKKGK